MMQLSSQVFELCLPKGNHSADFYNVENEQNFVKQNFRKNLLGYKIRSRLYGLNLLNPLNFVFKQATVNGHSSQELV